MGKHSFPIQFSRTYNYGLHYAAIIGDEEGVRRALLAGAEVNRPDGDGRTALMCAIGGENWQSIDGMDASFLTPERIACVRALLNTDMSLLTLNGPQGSVYGVTVLSLASWLNMCPVVELLLEGSSGLITVDGMDSHGATALMYACRDNGIDVARLLLHHGSRPDYRDVNFRSSIQFSLPHLPLLYLCESELRRHRFFESKSVNRRKLLTVNPSLLHIVEKSLPPSVNDGSLASSSPIDGPTVSATTLRLINTVLSHDLPSLHSLLFQSRPSSSSTPVIVNLPDSRGWSAIHYCTSSDTPSLQILDSLYLAGADVSLFTAEEHYSPLHTFALSHPQRGLSDTPFDFASHLVKDLRAPLAARDRDDETCIHIAAEFGEASVLSALLQLDDTGSVRNMRNARGMTALDVAKDEFRVLLGGAEVQRLPSSHSSFVIRASPSIASLASLANWNEHTDDEALSIAAASTKVSESFNRLLDRLCLTSPSLPPERLNSGSGQYLEEAYLLSNVTFTQLETRVRDTAHDLAELRQSLNNINHLFTRVHQSAIQKAASRGINPTPSSKRARQSEDSETTLVSRSRSSSLATSASTVVSECQESSVSPSSPADSNHSHSSTSASSTGQPPAIRKVSSKNKLASFGGTKIKAWIKERISPLDIFSQAKSESNKSSSVPQPAVSKPEIKLMDTLKPTSAPSTTMSTSDYALQTSQIVLDAVSRDTMSISCILDTAEMYVKKSETYLARIKRVLTRALKARKTHLDSSALSATLSELNVKPKTSIEEALSSILKSPNPSQRRGSTFLSPPPSPFLNTDEDSHTLSNQTSLASLASTIRNRDDVSPSLEDDDVRLLRRLILKKLDAHVEAALDEMDMALRWSRVVKEVLRSLKRRAHLSVR